MQNDANHVANVGRETQDRFYGQMNMIFLIILSDYFLKSSLEPGKAILPISQIVVLQGHREIVYRTFLMMVFEF